MKQRFPQVREPKQQDICYATQNRQDAVKVLAAGGGRGHRGGQPHQQQQQPPARTGRAPGHAGHMVDHADDLKPEWFDGRQRVGVTGVRRRPMCWCSRGDTAARTGRGGCPRKMDGVQSTWGSAAARSGRPQRRPAPNPTTAATATPDLGRWPYRCRPRLRRRPAPSMAPSRLNPPSKSPPCSTSTCCDLPGRDPAWRCKNPQPFLDVDRLNRWGTERRGRIQTGPKNCKGRRNTSRYRRNKEAETGYQRG